MQRTARKQQKVISKHQQQEEETRIDKMRSPPEDHQLPPKTRTKKKLRGKSSDLLGWFSFEDVWHEPTMMHLPLGSDSREFQDEEINSVLISKIRLEKVG